MFINIQVEFYPNNAKILKSYFINCHCLYLILKCKNSSDIFFQKKKNVYVKIYHVDNAKVL